MKNFIPTSRFVAFSLLAMAAVCTTGCLHHLGLNRSSLSPRMSSTEQTPVTLASAEPRTDSDTTFRSQDSEFGSDEPSTGHSQGLSPTISLMRPIQSLLKQQGGRPTPLPSMAAPTADYEALSISRQTPSESTAALQSYSGRSQVLPNAMDQRADDSRSAITLTPPSQQNPNSIGFNADQLRRFMNERAANPMSTGQVLADKQVRWDILNQNSAAGHSASGHSKIASQNRYEAPNPSEIQITPGVIQGQRAGTPTPSSDLFRTAGNSREVLASPAVVERRQPLNANFVEGDALDDRLSVNPIGLEQPFPVANEIRSAAAPIQSAFEDAADVISPPVDDSMLTRLKGLYDPSEDGVARRIWKAQIPKLPNPWSVFGDRKQPVVENPNQFVEVETSEFDFPLATQASGGEVQAPTASGSLLTQLVIEYESRLANWPKTPAERIENPDQFRKLQQELRLLYLLQDRPEEAVSAIDLLSPAEQQFFQSLMMSLAEYRKAQASESPAAHYTGSVHQLRAAVQALSPLADLRIRRLEICSRIHSYGRIETFPSNDFDPGRPLLLYVELENFGTTTTSSGRYLASFDATLQIIEKEKGLVKETIRLTDITDESTSARTDYFQSYDLTLPSHLMTGEYEIRLKMRDKFSGKTAVKVVSFQVR